jgi:predicted hydrocarbon binding protein
MVVLPYTELQPGSSENLTRDLERGLILEDGKRIISFRIATFQSIVKRLIELAGDKVARTLLYQIGNEIGRVALRYSRDKILADNNVKVFDDVLRLRGWGRCLGLDRKNGSDDAYVFTMADCPICSGVRGAAPMCDMMRGLVTGWMETFLDKKAIQSVEQDCAAVEGRLCVFEVTFRKGEPSE